MTCDNCPPEIKSKCRELCPNMLKLLERKPEGRLYSDRTIKRREQSYDPAILERKAGEIATRYKLGMSKGSDMSPEETQEENN